MSTRNTTFDLFKGIACIGIVLIHSPFPKPLGTGVQAFARFGVALFFCISGYYLSSEEKIDQSAIIRKIHHILILIAGAELFYSAFAFVINKLYDAGRRADYIEAAFKKGWFEKYIILNQPPVYAYLWFLYALLTVYLLVLLFIPTRKRLAVISRFLAPVLLICIILLQEFHDFGLIKNSFQLYSSETVFLRSSFFLFRAAPFFLIGFLLFEYREWVKSLSISRAVLIAGIILFEAISVIEGYIFPASQFYMGNIIACLLIMVLGIKYPRIKLQPFLYIGTELSTLVYIYHIAVFQTLNKIYMKVGLSESLLCNYIKPVFVVLITIFISWCHVTFIKNLQMISQPNK